MATNFIQWVNEEAKDLGHEVTITAGDVITQLNSWLSIILVLAISIVGYMVLMGYGRDILQRSIVFFFKFVIIMTVLQSFTHYDNTVGGSIKEIPAALIDLVNCDIAAPDCDDDQRYSKDSLFGTPANTATSTAEKIGLFDKQYTAFFILSKAAWNKANLLDGNLGIWLLSFTLIIFSTLFTLGAAFILISIFLLIQLLIIFGPLFIAAAIFKATENFFIKWLELVIKLILIEVFTVIISVFIYEKLEQLVGKITSVATDPFTVLDTDNAADIAADVTTNLEKLYPYITLSNITMICSIFFLGALILRLIIPIADELSKGVKMLGSAIVQSTNTFISSNTQANNQSSVYQGNQSSSFSSLFTQSTNNPYKQAYQQSINQNYSQNAHMTQANQYTNVQNSRYSQSSNDPMGAGRKHPVMQYKMAYQNRFRGNDF